MRLLKLFLMPICLAWLSPLALAQSLTTDRAKDFVDSLDAITSYSESLDPTIARAAFDDQMMPAPGESFAPYTRAVTYMQENHPEIYDEITELVSDHGFSSASAWAEVGDQVALAFIAGQINARDIAQISSITPEMLEQMPAEMRPQMEMMLTMVEAVKRTSQSDIDALRPLSDTLMQYMNMGPAQQ